MRSHTLLVCFFLFLFGPLSSKASENLCQDLDWLKSFDQKEELLLLQTQVTALKLASLIDIYENPTSFDEQAKALDLLTKIGSPLNDDHPLISNFESGPYLTNLYSILEETQRGLSQGRLTISYQSMPSLLMTYELSTGSDIFKQADFAVAHFWQEKNPNPDQLNPILEQLILIYHEMSRSERESLYQNLNDTLVKRWQELQNLALNSQCLISEEELFGACQIGPGELLEQMAVPFEKLSNQVTQILAFDLSLQLSRVHENNLEWKLHPPPAFDQTQRSPQGLNRKFKGIPYTEFRRQKSWLEEIEDSGDLHLIKAYRELEESGPYLVLDKEKERLFLFEGDGALKGSMGVGLETTWDTRNDQAMTEKRGTGAGIYQVNTINDNMMELSDQRQRGSLLETKGFGVDCSRGACSEALTDLEALLKRHDMLPPLPLYILPYEERFEFVIKNNQLSFTTFERGLNYFQYNFTPRETEAFPTKFRVKNPAYDTPFTREFLGALESEKPQIMKLYNLDNDEFNELALLAFGILGQESQFGEHWRYHVKESFPGGVAYLKNYKNIFKDFSDNKEEKGFWSALGNMLKESWQNEIDYLSGDISTAQNSRGPTQIKDVPDIIESHYKISKEDLNRPRNAALATIGFLAQSLEELKAKEKFHPDINGRNRFNYLHYIYMGRSSEITRGTATPEQNIYYRNIRSFSDSLEIWQDLTNS